MESDASTPAPETLIAPAVSPEDVRQLVELSRTVFGPREGLSLEDQVARVTERWLGVERPPETAGRCLVIRLGGRIVASASLYPKTVQVGAREDRVAGLAGVMTHPEHRRQGLGARLVSAVLSTVDAREFAYALFQTGPGRAFYERLGCRVLEQPVVDATSGSDDNPFWEAHVMVYDPHGAVPSGTLGLQGPGF